MRYFVDQALALGSASVESHQVGFRPSFIKKYQLIRVQARLLHDPSGALTGDIGTILLSSLQDFFLKVNCNWRSARARVGMLSEVFNCCCNSFSVRSG